MEKLYKPYLLATIFCLSICVLFGQDSLNSTLPNHIKVMDINNTSEDFIVQKGSIFFSRFNKNGKLNKIEDRLLNGEYFKEIPTTKKVSILDKETKFIKLSKNSHLVYVTDPDIVTLREIDKNNFFIVGISPGTSDLYALDKNNKPILALKITVQSKDKVRLRALNKMLRDNYQDATNFKCYFL